MSVLKILIVEDDLLLAENLSEELLDFGYTITDIASNSDDGLRAFRKRLPDLILMDIHLEGSSLETIRLMVASGMGVTVLPQTSINDYAYPKDLLGVRPFSEPVPRRTVALAWRKSFPRPEAVKVLAETVRSCPLGNAVRIIN